MSEAYLAISKRLDQALNPKILWLSNSEAEKFLNISPATRKRYAEILRELQPLGWDTSWRYRRGLNRRQLEIFWEFCQLIFYFDKAEAIQEICKVMELIHHESERQRARRAS